MIRIEQKRKTGWLRRGGEAKNIRNHELQELVEKGKLKQN